MRNIFSLLVRYHAFILFVLLEVSSIVLIVNNKSYHRAAFINSSSVVSAQVFSVYDNFIEYLHLSDENKRLANENASLRSQLKSSFYDASFQQITVNDSANKQLYKYIPAKVINITTNKLNNYITIDKGKNQGVDVKMAVIGSDGIVGIVKDVSDNYASVISLLHNDFRVSARVGDGGNLGSLSWDGSSPEQAQLDEIPKQIKIHNGDKIYTSGESKKFPEHILIGTISSFTPNTNDNFYDIEVKLSTNFRSISYVYVVNNLMKNEQETLEQRSQNDN
ncbi:MAG: rod shape-determining protein MreC [Bacteroidota bacterium]